MCVAVGWGRGWHSRGGGWCIDGHVNRLWDGSRGARVGVGGRRGRGGLGLGTRGVGEGVRGGGRGGCPAWAISARDERVQEALADGGVRGIHCGKRRGTRRTWTSRGKRHSTDDEQRLAPLSLFRCRFNLSSPLQYLVSAISSVLPASHLFLFCSDMYMYKGTAMICRNPWCTAQKWQNNLCSIQHGYVAAARWTSQLAGFRTPASPGLFPSGSPLSTRRPIKSGLCSHLLQCAQALPEGVSSE